MLGLAIGDALGAPTEFLTYENIRKRYGPQGLQGYNRVPAMFTDDTQMSMAVAEALIEAGASPLELLMASVRARFLEWLHSPDNFRFPGITTVNALQKLEEKGDWRTCGNPKSKGCGAVMRTAPIGYFYRKDPARLREAALAVGRVTHSHPTSDAATLAASWAVKLALEDVPPEKWVKSLLECARGISKECDECLKRAAEAPLFKDDHKAVQFICKDNSGWTAEEVLGTALYSVLRHPDDFRAALLLSVNTAGDSDSIGCVAGSLLGARLGAEAIPKEWVEGVERRADLEGLADRLVQCMTA